MFNPKKLTPHDIEVQIHTIQSLIDSIKETHKETVNIITLEQTVTMGKIQLLEMTKGEKSI